MVAARHVDTAKQSAQKVREHYRRVMPDKKHHRVAIWCTFFAVVGIICAQLLYPPDRSLPFARLDSAFVGNKSHDELAALLAEKFSTTEIIIAASPYDYVRTPFAQTGAELESETLITSLSKYPLWLRYIPLSILFAQPRVDDLPVSYTAKVLDAFSNSVAKKLSSVPANARLDISHGTIIAIADKPGFDVAARNVKTQLSTAKVAAHAPTFVKVEAKTVAAKTTASDMQAVYTEAESALAKPVAIRVAESTFAPSREDVASWLKIDVDESGEPTLTVDRSKLVEYLDAQGKSLVVASGTTNITLVNGIETGRQEGAAGKRVPSEQIAEQIAAQLIDISHAEVSIGAQLIDVPPIVMYNNRYTSSQEGLQAYVTDAARTKNANIVVKQLDGSKWYAAADENLSTVSASTYKLYVSLYLFDQMKKGNVSWNDPMLDTTVSGCFDRMTIASTNPCAEAWLSQWGRSTVNDFVYAHGFSRGTSFTNPIATHTTAADLAKYMEGLENSTLVDGAYRDRLLRSLSVHPYREGVPSGSAGQVWDKVGFLWDYVHDAAIVHHPKGRYVIVVMTKGRSYATIAGITREVEKILYP